MLYNIIGRLNLVFKLLYLKAKNKLLGLISAFSVLWCIFYYLLTINDKIVFFIIKFVLVLIFLLLFFPFLYLYTYFKGKPLDCILNRVHGLNQTPYFALDLYR